jgi:hypothetical protein
MLLLLCAAPAPAAAESPIAEVICAPRAQMEQRLARQYRSALQATGLRGPETVVEIWADAQGRWTLVQRYAQGQSCILAMGDGWTGVAQPPA